MGSKSGGGGDGGGELVNSECCLHNQEIQITQASEPSHLPWWKTSSKKSEKQNNAAFSY